MEWNPKKIGLAVWIAFFTIALYLSGIFFLLTPLPLFYWSLRGDKQHWFFGLLAIIALSLLFYFGILPRLVPAEELFSVRFTSLSHLAYYLLVSFLLSLGVWKRWRLVGWGGGLGLSVTIAVLLGAFFCQKMGLFDFLGSLRHSLQEASHVLDQMAASPSLQQNRLEILTFIEQTKEGLKFLPYLLPSLVFIFTVFTMMLNLGVLSLVSRDVQPMKWAGPFHRLQIPLVFVWIVIGAGFGFFLDYYVLKVGFLKIVAANLFVAVAFVYFVQGLSILAFFLRRYSLLFRFGIYGLVVLFFQMMGLLVVGLGFADTWFDFRKLLKQPAGR